MPPAIRTAHLWLPGHVWRRVLSTGRKPPKRVWLAICDHFEPLWRGADEATGRSRVELWHRLWPEIAARHRDSTGRPPRYSFFYPEEEYRPQLLEPLAQLSSAGIADVEVHLHHDGEGEARFVERMGSFTEALHRSHGLLRTQAGRIVFGFIHGNWALDNARPDGRWCGLNNEISLLRDLGCYADFTLPAAPNPSQAGPINAIFRVRDDPRRPRSHSRGWIVRPGLPAEGDLTLVTGPLGLDWRGRPWWRPRIETGELAAYSPPSRARVDLWLELAPRIGGDVFIKLFAHGAQESNARSLLGGDLDRLFSDLEAVCRERSLHLSYVSAWEMWCAVEALRLCDPAAASGEAREREATPGSFHQ